MGLVEVVRGGGERSGEGKEAERRLAGFAFGHGEGEGESKSLGGKEERVELWRGGWKKAIESRMSIMTNEVVVSIPCLQKARRKRDS